MYRILGTDGKEYGPVGVDQVRQWIAEGRANASTRGRAEGEQEWRPLASLPELAAALGAPPGGEGARWTPPSSPLAAVPNYLTQAILVTLFCCLPFGVPAIVFASQVNTKLQMGDLAGARESSRKAKLWCWLSVGGYAAAIMIYGAFAFVAASDGGLE